MRANTIAGFVVAPLAAPLPIWLAFAIAWLLQLGWLADGSFGTFVAAMFMFAVYVPFFAYPVAIVLGVPAYVIARKRNWLTLPHAIAIGVIVAVAPLFAYWAYVAVNDGSYVFNEVRDAMWWTMLFAISGASSGAAFWGIALRVRRNNAGF